MPEKIGGGGELEKFSPNDGKYVADGKPNKYYDNPSEKVEEYKIPGLDMSHPSAVSDVRRMAFDKLIDNDKTRLYRYREWANNSNDDYKKYIYDDLKSGKKEATLNIWYNTYKSSTGNYNISFEDFLNTPIKLYRATNIDEKEDYSNPFFSYATTRKMAERFLDGVQRLNAKRTGDIEEIEIKPIDTFGMFPSDENEIIIPNKKYEELLSKVDNLISIAEKQNVKLPYDRETLIELFRRDKKQEKVERFEKDILRYINRNNVKK